MDGLTTDRTRQEQTKYLYFLPPLQQPLLQEEVPEYLALYRETATDETNAPNTTAWD